MSKQDDGGNAFPETATNDMRGGIIWPLYEDHGGMTLLDCFAGQSLAGAMGNQEFIRAIENSFRGEGHAGHQFTAKKMYDFAAAMVAEKRRREASHE